MKILQTALLCACAIAGQASAAPVFQLGADNTLGFQSVANKTGGAAIAVGDQYYGVINVQDIATTANGTSWNANNVASQPPIDSFTGYFLAQVTGVTATVTGLGTFYSVQLGVATNDPNGIFSTADLSAGSMMKLYTDTGSAYTTGAVATDIAHATDGTFWGSLGMTSASNHWTFAISPPGFAAPGGSIGSLNFVQNNSGLTWGKVLDTNCTVGSCLVDMPFSSTLSQNAGGAWQFNVNDPAVLHPVPLPAAGWLLGSGLIGLLGLSGRRKRRAALARGI